MLEMQDVLKEFSADKDIGCVVLTGSEKAFAGTSLYFIRFIKIKGKIRPCHVVNLYHTFHESLNTLKLAWIWAHCHYSQNENSPKFSLMEVSNKFAL